MRLTRDRLRWVRFRKSGHLVSDCQTSDRKFARPDGAWSFNRRWILGLVMKRGATTPPPLTRSDFGSNQTLLRLLHFTNTATIVTFTNSGTIVTFSKVIITLWKFDNQNVIYGRVTTFHVPSTVVHKRSPHSTARPYSELKGSL